MVIENKRFGTTEKPLLIAELSANHDRDLDQALALVEIAAASGWDCLKLQTYTADSLTLRTAHPSAQIDSVWGKRNLYDLYESACMPMSFHEPLFALAREMGLLPFTSIYDPQDLDFLEKLGCPLYKIASFELTFDALLVEVGRTGKPVILSTGMATLDEVAHALEVLDRHGASHITLLHCCSSYPAPFEHINLRAMVSMGQHFDRDAGFSDHTIGARAALAAASLGAVAIEKHFTNDCTRPGPDHRFSATPKVLQEIALGVQEIHVLRGSERKQMTSAEQVSADKGRRSAFALVDLPAGHVLGSSDFRFVRPNAGIPANTSVALIGQTMARAVSKGSPITWQDLAA